MGTKSKEEKIIENMTAVPIIDVNVDVKIPQSATKFDPSKHKFKCSCCGNGFTSQNGNFQKSNDVLFQANGGYLPWCKDCTDSYVNSTVLLYSNNEELAMKDFCHRAGWNYDVSALTASMETYSGHRSRSRISHYAAKKNLNCNGRKTYIDTIKYNYTMSQNEIIQSKEQVKSDGLSVSISAVDRWGVGFSELDYKNLEDHYKMLKKNNPNCDNNQEIFIKSLCNINMLMVRALKDGDSDKYVKLTEQYSKTFTKAGLKTIQEVDGSADECLGVTLATISQFTPEEYYTEDKLYRDFDGLGDYFNRFVKRPLKNLMTGSTDRDHEFYVKEKDGDVDE